MKTKITISVLCVCFALLSYVFYSESKIKDLAFDNIEALAAGEGGDTYCVGSGSIECYGRKVKFRADNLR